MDTRERERRVRELRAQGLSQNAIARTSGIPRRTVQRILQRLDQRLASMRSIRFAPTSHERSEYALEQRAHDLSGTMLGPASEGRPGERGMAATRLHQTPQEPGHLPGEEGRRQNAAAVEPEAATSQLPLAGLPPRAQQLYDMAMKIGQVEAQRLHRAEVQTRQVEEALRQALQNLQDVRVEQSTMMREVTQSVGELLQATGQLLQQLPGEGD
jgi:Homeodomain-like domain